MRHIILLDSRLAKKTLFWILPALLLTADPAKAGYYVWSNDSGPYGGRIQTMEFLGEDVYFAGTRHGGVFISHDSGGLWQHANQGLTSLIINCSCVNPLNENTVFIGTGGSGIFRTTRSTSDCTWLSKSYNLGNSNILSLAVSPADTNSIFAGTLNGIYKSPNFGEFWTDITSDLGDPSVNTIAVADNGLDTIYVGTNSGVFKSVDGGASWVEKNNGLANPFVKSLEIDPQNNNIVVAATFGGVFKSIDGGEIWIAKNSGLSNVYVRDIEIDPESTVVYFAGTEGGFFISTNGGNSWTEFSDNLTCREVLAVAVDSTGQNLLAGTYWGGIYKSVERAPWDQIVEGMNNTFITDIDVNPVDNTIIQVTSYGQVFINGSGGQGWIESSEGIVDEDLQAIAIDPVAPDTVYCGAYYGGVYKSTDGGITWTLMNDGLNSTTVTCLAVDYENNNIVYAGTYSYLYRSTDGGRHWEQKSSGVSADHTWTIELDPIDPSIIYIGTYGGGIFKSTDSGENWNAINNGLPEEYVKAIAVDPVDNDIVYAGTYYNGGIYKSINGGSNWFFSSDGLANRDIWSIDVHPDRHDQVIAGTYGGVFISLDAGTSWEDFSGGLDVLDTRCVVYDHLETRNIIAGTYGGGVYKYDGIYCSVDDIAQTPGAMNICSLYPNFPNPFNPSTTLRYRIHDTNGARRKYPVNMKIYDVRGRLVKNLVDNIQGPGEYYVFWDGYSNKNVRVSSGIYFCRLQVGNDIQSIKLVNSQ